MLPETGTDPPAYRFTPDGPPPSSGEVWLVDQVPHLSLSRRLVAAYRRPADETALPLQTWFYLVEFDSGADIAHLQGQLRVGYPERGLVEVFAVGEDLPPYHIEALRAGRALSRDT